VIAENGGALVHPFNDPDVIAGQGTIGLEIAADCDAMGIRPDTVAMPCGGGGLSSGIGVAVKDWSPGTDIVLVEPAGFDDYARSLKAGTPQTNPAAAGSVCDALLSTAPGAIGFALNQANHAKAVAVSDEEALAAVAFAYRELTQIVEPGGAVALAAILAGRIETRNKVTVAVLSGGNIDEAMLARALALPVRTA
jgi:threonine dehydratase